MHKPDCSLKTAVFVLSLVVSCAWAFGQEAPATAPAPAAAPAAATMPAVDVQLADQWDNLLHYILLARADLAQQWGQAIIKSSPNVKDLYYLSIRSAKTAETLARGRSLKDMAPIIDQIAKLIDDGAKGVRMDPAEIARWIENLSGSPRQFLSATDRLVNAGEYAVPQMINALADPKTPAVARERIITVLRRLGKDAVRPLTEALQVKDPAVQEIICRSLGQIGYKHAAPYLKAMLESKDALERVRQAAQSALAQVDAKAAKKPVAELFYEVALKYYHHDDSVGPDERYETANVWYWQEGLGLTSKLVPRVIFNDVYAMREARQALQSDAGFYPAVILWLAADLRKEGELPTGATDPTHSPDEPGAYFHALASSAKYLQGVLELALKDGDTAVAAKAISALSVTAGAENLLAEIEGGAQPLVSALSYPVREVRYMAAETLAAARPQRKFAGAPLVVSVLIEALRQTGVPTAVLADRDPQHRNKIKDLLRTAGMEVVDAAALGPALQTARNAGGVDLVVLTSDVTGPDMAKALVMLRGEAALARLPVVIIARAADLTVARDLAKSDPLAVVVGDEQADAAGLAGAVKGAQAKAAGNRPATAPGIGEEASADWAIRACAAFKMLAETRNPVYDLVDAVKSLIAATKDKRDGIRIAAADALSQYRADAAQQAIADLADDAGASEEVRLPAYASLSASVRQFGNQLTDKQVKAILDTVSGKGSLKLRQGAAQALGALALPSEKIKELILSAK